MKGKKDDKIIVFSFQNMKTQKNILCYNAIVPNFYNMDVSCIPVATDGQVSDPVLACLLLLWYDEIRE